MNDQNRIEMLEKTIKCLTAIIRGDEDSTRWWAYLAAQYAFVELGRVIPGDEQF